MRITLNTLALLLALGIGVSCAGERIHRDRAQRDTFVKTHACPATGSFDPHRACHGYHVDHVTPLCAGGADAPENMQWLSVEEHKAKTRIDVKRCRELHEGGQ